jgi:endonuclease/exonuclease/phosphatase family metal-dependent hydrolase
LRRERIAQVEALLGPEWLGHRQCRAPVVFCGDLNALPSSPVCSRLKSRLADVQDLAVGHRPRGTFSSRMPNLRIDHVFVSAAVEVTGIEVADSELARVASDHLPLVAQLRVG